MLNKGKTIPFLSLSSVPTTHIHVITPQCLFQVKTPESGWRGEGQAYQRGAPGADTWVFAQPCPPGLVGKPGPIGRPVWASVWGLGIAVPLRPSQKKPVLAALPLLAAPLSGPAWLLAVQRALVPGQVRMEFCRPGLEGGWGEQMLHSPDAPFSPWGPQSPYLLLGRASGHITWMWASLPQGRPWGRERRPVLFSE